LEAIQGVELTLFNMFFLIALVILVSNSMYFGAPLLLADGLVASRYRRPGPCRSPPTSLPIRGDAVGAFQGIMLVLCNLFFLFTVIMASAATDFDPLYSLRMA
jgi:hypothetical protein